MSVAAVAAGLGSGLAFNSDRIARLTEWGVFSAVAAATGFGIVVLAAVMIWRPALLTLTLDPGVIVGSYVEGNPPASLPETHRELALHLGKHVRVNRDEISNRLTWFQVALLAFLLEIGGLMLVLLDVAA